MFRANLSTARPEDRATLGSDSSAEVGERRRGSPSRLALLLYPAPLEFPKAINSLQYLSYRLAGIGSEDMGAVLLTTRSIAL